MGREVKAIEHECDAFATARRAVPTAMETTNRRGINHMVDDLFPWAIGDAVETVDDFPWKLINISAAAPEAARTLRPPSDIIPLVPWPP